MPGGLHHSSLLCPLADVLFEVAAEITPRHWMPHGRSKLQKGLLNSVKSHVSRQGKREKTQCGASALQLEEPTVCAFTPGAVCEAPRVSPLSPPT